MIPKMKDQNFTGKRVLIRIDIDVPLKNGIIVDDTRLQQAVPTIKQALVQGARQIILAGHIGRPEGRYVEELSTKPIALHFNKLIGKTVQHVDDCIDVELPNTPIVMLENTRFHKEEETNEKEFAKKLSLHADYFIMDAFATAHRAHASTAGIAAYIPASIGLVIEKELDNLTFDHAKRPLVAILGGAKLETKLPLIQTLINTVDHILVGGAMMFTFYKAQNYEIGNSLLDEKNISMAKMLVNNDKLTLPTDVVVAPSPQEPEKAKTVIAQGIPAGYTGLDIGSQSTEEFKKIMSNAKTIVWNGPLGMVEQEPFDIATKEIALHMASLTEQGVRTIIGGGDSIKIVNAMGLANKFSHVSTGGGASMKVLEGKPLAALQAIEQR